MVRKNAQRLSQIVEEILDIARVQHQAGEPVGDGWSWTWRARPLPGLDGADTKRSACNWCCAPAAPWSPSTATTCAGCW
jgi:hypothetical protein